MHGSLERFLAAGLSHTPQGLVLAPELLNDFINDLEY